MRHIQLYTYVAPTLTHFLLCSPQQWPTWRWSFHYTNLVSLPFNDSPLSLGCYPSCLTFFRSILTQVSFIYFLFIPEPSGLLSISRMSHTLDCLITFAHIPFLSQHLCLANTSLTFNLQLKDYLLSSKGSHQAVPQVTAQHQAFLPVLAFHLQISISNLLVIYAIPRFPAVSCYSLSALGQGLFYFVFCYTTSI